MWRRGGLATRGLLHQVRMPSHATCLSSIPRAFCPSGRPACRLGKGFVLGLPVRDAISDLSLACPRCDLRRFDLRRCRSLKAQGVAPEAHHAVPKSLSRLYTDTPRLHADPTTACGPGDRMRPPDRHHGCAAGASPSPESLPPAQHRISGAVIGQLATYLGQVRSIPRASIISSQRGVNSLAGSVLGCGALDAVGGYTLIEWCFLRELCEDTCGSNGRLNRTYPHNRWSNGWLRVVTGGYGGLRRS